jgi:hypothetical protein
MSQPSGQRINEAIESADRTAWLLRLHRNQGLGLYQPPTYLELADFLEESLTEWSRQADMYEGDDYKEHAETYNRFVRAINKARGSITREIDLMEVPQEGEGE